MSDWDKYRPDMPAPISGPKSAPDSKAPRAAALERLARATGVHLGEAAACLLLDCSASMAEGRKLESAKGGAVEFAESALRKGYALSVTAFADAAVVKLEPTREMDTIRHTVDRLFPGGTTNMAEGLTIAITTLKADASTKAIVLVTDGEPNDRDAALLAASAARALGIEIICIGTDDADVNFLKQLATRTDLATVVPRQDLGKAIAKSIDRLGLPPAR